MFNRYTYWRFNLSVTCSMMGPSSSIRALYCSSVQFAASPPTTTSTGAFREYDFMKASTWSGIGFTKCLMYIAKCPVASFSLSTRGAILGLPRCGTNNLAMGSAASSCSFSCARSSRSLY